MKLSRAHDVFIFVNPSRNFFLKNRKQIDRIILPRKNSALYEKKKEKILSKVFNRGVEINFFKRMVYKITLCLARHAKFARFRIYRTKKKKKGGKRLNKKKREKFFVEANS